MLPEFSEHPDIKKNNDLTECLNAFEVSMTEIEKEHALHRKQEKDKRRRSERKNREAFMVSIRTFMLYMSRLYDRASGTAGVSGKERRAHIAQHMERFAAHIRGGPAISQRARTVW